MVLVSPTFAAVTIPTGGSLSIPSAGALNLGCTNATTQGTLFAASSQINQVANFNIESTGSVYAGQAIINVGTSWNNAGSFDPGTSTVVVDDSCGTSPFTFTGRTTFYNLILRSTAGRSFVIPAGLNLTVLGTLTLQGAQGLPISLVSSSASVASISLAPGAAIAATYATLSPNVQTGVAPAAPAVTLNPTWLMFSNQEVGSTSSGRGITLTNSGSAALSITAIGSTMGSIFGVTHNCGATLAASANCTLNVTFTPQAVETRAASIIVTTNAVGSPRAVPVTGAGIPSTAPVCTLSASPSRVPSGRTSTLSAMCSPTATSLAWGGGTCAGNTASSCTVTPTATTTYRVTGANTSGSSTATATVTIGAIDLTPILMLLLD